MWDTEMSGGASVAALIAALMRSITTMRREIFGNGDQPLLARRRVCRLLNTGQSVQPVIDRRQVITVLRQADRRPDDPAVVRVAGDDLRSGIHQGGGERPVHLPVSVLDRAGHPEVAEEHPLTITDLNAEQQVGRLDVVVHDVALVGIAKALGDLTINVDYPVRCHRAARRASSASVPSTYCSAIHSSPSLVSTRPYTDTMPAWSNWGHDVGFADGPLADRAIVAQLGIENLQRVAPGRVGFFVRYTVPMPPVPSSRSMRYPVTTEPSETMRSRTRHGGGTVGKRFVNAPTSRDAREWCCDTRCPSG